MPRSSEADTVRRAIETALGWPNLSSDVLSLEALAEVVRKRKIILHGVNGPVRADKAIAYLLTLPPWSR